MQLTNVQSIIRHYGAGKGGFDMKHEDGKHYCWNCKEVEIEKPQYCCMSSDCGCLGKPIDPPYCKICWEKRIELTQKDGAYFY